MWSFKYNYFFRVGLYSMFCSAVFKDEPSMVRSCPEKAGFFFLIILHIFVRGIFDQALFLDVLFDIRWRSIPFPVGQ